MIPVNQIQRNVGFAESSNLINKKETSVVVAPIAVVEIPSDQDESDFLLNCQVDEITQGASSGVPNLLDRCSLVLLKPA